MAYLGAELQGFGTKKGVAGERERERERVVCLIWMDFGEPPSFTLFSGGPKLRNFRFYSFIGDRQKY